MNATIRTAVPRLKPYDGPALLSYGFRPFFFLGPLFAGIAVLVWWPMFDGRLNLPTGFTGRDWHVHEMLFGFTPAVIAGFLLTAIPNWTGRLPLQGLPLATLVATWAAGRLAVLFSAHIGWLAALAIDGAFLLAMAAATGREIVSGRNWRNLPIVGLLTLLGVANIAFHVEAHTNGIAVYTARLGIAVVVMMIMVVGGRIIPSFTRNWLMRRPPGRLPAPVDRFDELALMLSALALAGWVADPEHAATGVALLAAGLVDLVRLARWAGERTLSDRLVLILHIGFAFVPVGFLLLALAAFGAVIPSAGIHAWTAGAIGIMTLAVMSRASLGHTGRPLAATPALQAVYATAVIGAVARICSALHAGWSEVLIPVAAIAWAGAVLGFAALYAPLLLRAKRTRE